MKNSENKKKNTKKNVSSQGQATTNAKRDTFLKIVFWCVIIIALAVIASPSVFLPDHRVSDNNTLVRMMTTQSNEIIRLTRELVKVKAVRPDGDSALRVSLKRDYGTVWRTKGSPKQIKWVSSKVHGGKTGIEFPIDDKGNLILGFGDNPPPVPMRIVEGCIFKWVRIKNTLDAGMYAVAVSDTGERVWGIYPQKVEE